MVLQFTSWFKPRLSLLVLSDMNGLTETKRQHLCPFSEAFLLVKHANFIGQSPKQIISVALVEAVAP